MKYKTSQYFLFTDIIDEMIVDKKRIIYSTRTGEAAVISDKIFQSFQVGDFDKIDNVALQELFRMEVLVPENQDEFTTILEQNIEEGKDDRTLSAVIQPSANCQLGCHYCGQSHAKHTMDDKILSKVVERIKRQSLRKQFDTLGITWFGGEPLMGFGQIKALSKELISFAKENRLSYRGKIVTNAVSLKKELARELIKDCLITYFQITIDGSREFHDKRRITKKTGNPTFDIIIANLADLVNTEEFRTSNAFVELRMNIDRTNAEGITELIDFLYERKLNEVNLALHFAPILDWGGNGAAKESLSHDEYAEQEIDWFMYAISKGFQVGNLIPKRRHSPCMVVNENDEVYDAYGNISPCYEFTYTPMYNSPEYMIGNLNFDEATYDNEVMPRKWFTDIKNNISWCPKCKFFPVCGGACPKQWYNSEPPCPSFKFNSEDRLILQNILNKKGQLNELT